MPGEKKGLNVAPRALILTFFLLLIIGLSALLFFLIKLAAGESVGEKVPLKVTDQGVREDGELLEKIESLAKKLHGEKRNEFFSVNRQYYDYVTKDGTYSLYFAEAKPSTYDFSSTYLYTLMYCYFDESGDCVGPDVTREGIEVSQDEEILSFNVREKVSGFLNDVPVYLVIVRTSELTHYALYYSLNVASPSAGSLGNYKMLATDQWHDGIISLAGPSSDENVIGTLSQREQAGVRVTYNLRFAVDSKGDVTYEMERLD